MRRISPSTLQRQQAFRQIIIPKRAVSLQPSRTSARNLASCSPLLYPRSGPYARFQSSNSTPAEEDDVDEASFEHELEDLSSSADGDSSTPPHTPFHELVVSVTHPQPTGTSIPDELRSLHHHMLTAFLPANQPVYSSPPTLTPVRSNLAIAEQWPAAAATEIQEPEQASEAVLALVSPFEGGRHYVEDAVKTVASEIDAEILRFDLALGIGLQGPSSPLGLAGSSAPALTQSTNPLLQDSPKPSTSSSPFASHMPSVEEETDEQDEDGESKPSNAMFLLPRVHTMSMPFGNSMPFLAFNNEATPGSVIKEDWVAFFENWINKDSGGSRNRIILLESVEAMSSTFEEWWPSFVEAVRRRRRNDSTPPSKGKKSKGAYSSTPSLTQPTIIIFSSSPSMLLPHTAGPLPPAADSLKSAVDNLHPMLQELAEKYGGMLETRIENGEPSPLWWGSEETDVAGRQERDGRRVSALLDRSKGPSSLLPPFSSRSNSKNPAQRNPQRSLPRNISELLGEAPSRPGPSEDKSDTVVWKALPIIPAERDRGRELLERVTTRSLLGSGLLSKAVTDLGGELTDPVSAASHLEVELTNSKRQWENPLILRLSTDPAGSQISNLLQGRPYKVSYRGWQNVLRSWRSIQELAVTAVGQKLARPTSDELVPGSVQLSWKDVLNASRNEKTLADKMRKRMKQLLPRKSISSRPSSKAADSSTAEPVVDTVVNQVKKAKDLNSHEKRLLGCIVDTSKLASTTFDDVHLPYKTIDAIRTIISLPLLFPDAFKGGVLKDHSTTGALLFGPPGTGKTLLARAVANESGARMLAIQPSDVNDKYFGEGEKLVKAVFSLARRLSPCVVFLDEVDALFGARSSRGAGFGNKAHDQLLTEFMQEMDGLSSSEINKDKRVVVVGATNRPFDLDDAVLRRLPRRLLVDLPGAEDRKAILEILLRGENLGEDVVIDNIVKETDGFSGSDLKHLCVSAALAAVKDNVHVPWSKAVPNKAQNVERHSEPEPSTGAARSENLVLEADQDTSKPELIVEPSASLPSHEDQNPQIVISAARPEESPATEEESHSSALEEDTVTSDTSDTPESAESDAASADLKGAKNNSSAHFTPRILLKKHFDTALGEIRPSSSEEGSLPELRKWAEQFGEGGSQRGRKKGFGKGFGFADEASKSNRDHGYGKVAEDD